MLPAAHHGEVCKVSSSVGRTYVQPSDFALPLCYQHTMILITHNGGKEENEEDEEVD